MPRIKGGVKTKQRHKKYLKAAKGYRGGRGTLYRTAREAVERGWAYAYRGPQAAKKRLPATVDRSDQCRGPANTDCPIRG